MRSSLKGDLIPYGTYIFHSRFRRAVNFTDGNVLVTLVTGELGPGPLNVVVDHLDPEPLGTLAVNRDGIQVDGRSLCTPETPRYRSGWAAQGWSRESLALRLPWFRARILDQAGENSLAFLLAPGPHRGSGFQRAYAERMAAGAEALFAADPAAGARQLKGCGPGLTPGGDDFLAGHLFGLHGLRSLCGGSLRPRLRAVHRAALGGNPFSNTFLHLACLGRPAGPLRELLDALAGGTLEALNRAADRMLAVGASSGADLATGLHLTLSRGVALWP